LPVAAPTPKLTAPGRESELDLLVAAIGELTRGRGGAVVVEGEAGIGKTHLARAMGTAAADHRVCVLEGRADEYDLDRPLAAIADALLRRPATDADERLAGLLAGEPSPFLVVDAIVASLEIRALNRPVLLVLEDLHWADPLTVSAIGSLWRRLGDAPLLAVLTARPYPRSAELAALVHDLDAAGERRIHLGPLAAEAVGALATAFLGADPGPDLTARLRAAGGNPLLVIELLRSLRVDGGLVGTDAGWDISPGDSVRPIPSGLGALLHRRLAGLPPDAREATRVAAILGPTFSLGDLAIVLGEPPLEVMRDLDPALAAGVLRAHGQQLTFGHELVREAIYRDIPEPFRVELHRTAAEALLAAGRPVLHAAHQLAQGAAPGDLEAVRLLRRAAEELIPSAPSAAVDLLQRALHLVEPGQARDITVSPGTGGRERAAAAASIRAALAVPLAWLGRTTEAIAHGEAALGGPLDAADVLAARMGLSRALVMDGRLHDAVAQTEEAVRSPELSDRDRAGLLAEASLARLLCGDLARARDDATDACRLAEVADNPAALSAALCTLAWRAGFLGRFGEALRTARRAVEVATAAGPEAMIRHPHFFRGLIELDADLVDEAVGTLAVGRRAGEELGTLWNLPLYHWLAALACYRLGRWDDTIAELEAGVAASEEIGCRTGLLWSSAFSALVAVNRDDLPAAHTAIARARAEVDRLGPQYGYQWVLMAEAELAEVEGDRELANRLAQEAWEIDDALGLVSELRTTGPAACRAALAVGDRERAAAVAARMEEAARFTRLASYEGAAHRCRGMLDGDPSVLQAAVEAYRRARHPVDLALALEDTAVALVEAGRVEEARPVYDEAQRLFERLGALRLARRAAARLRAHGVRQGVRGARQRPVTGAASLTETERRVLALVRDRLTNGDIAARLFISRRTVETHVSHILAKFGASSRRELIDAP
jgi:DNA-binding CsgD family transcriptional regulator